MCVCVFKRSCASMVRLWDTHSCLIKTCAVSTHARTQRVNRHMVGRITEAHDTPPFPPTSPTKCWCLGISTVESVETRCPWNQTVFEVIYGASTTVIGQMSSILFSVQNIGGRVLESGETYTSCYCEEKARDASLKKETDVLEKCSMQRSRVSLIVSPVPLSAASFQRAACDRCVRLSPLITSVTSGVTTCRPVAWSVTHVGCRGDDSLMRTRSSVLILCVMIWYLLGHRLRPCFVLPVSFLAFPSQFQDVILQNAHENFLVQPHSPPRCAQTSYSFTRALMQPHEGRSKINRDALFCCAAGWNNIPLNNPNSAPLKCSVGRI